MSGVVLLSALVCIFGGLRKIATEEWESWGRLDHGQIQLVWGGVTLGFGFALLLVAGVMASSG